MRRSMSKAAMSALFVICCGLVQNAQAGGMQTYLSIGDSIGFGETVFSSDSALGPYADPSDGDRGFVAMYANFLASRYGYRPNVINLAVDGETSTSFTTGVGRVPPGPGFTDASLAELNTHYTGTPPPTQASLLASTIASQAAAGHVIGNVSISLGSNDLFALALTSKDPLADLPAALATFKSNYESILTTLRAAYRTRTSFCSAPTTRSQPLQARRLLPWRATRSRCSIRRSKLWQASSTRTTSTSTTRR